MDPIYHHKEFRYCSTDIEFSDYEGTVTSVSVEPDYTIAGVDLPEIWIVLTDDPGAYHIQDRRTLELKLCFVRGFAQSLVVG